MNSFRVVEGDVLTGLASLPDSSVRCCVTSPPYWGLRDYGHEGQIGLEATPELYVARMVDVFREVGRVLADDGTLWLNLGDCYATGAGKVGNHPGGGAQGARWAGDVDRIRDDKRGYRGERLANGRGDEPAVLRQKTRATRDGRNCGKNAALTALGPMTQPNRMPIEGLKPKDLVGIPWRVAFSLQADGWFLRSDIIWAKPNPMPESVTDRPTKAHEYLFLLAKSQRYYYDAKAIAEPFSDERMGNSGAYNRTSQASKGSNRDRADTGFLNNGAGWNADAQKDTRNRRTVWTVATQPYREAHFAVMPEALVEPCILAGSAAGDTVLDPFAGSGTVGVVANRHGRNFVGVELNPKYAEMARDRIRDDQPMFNVEAAS